MIEGVSEMCVGREGIYLIVEGRGVTWEVTAAVGGAPAAPGFSVGREIAMSEGICVVNGTWAMLVVRAVDERVVVVAVVVGGGSGGAGLMGKMSALYQLSIAIARDGGETSDDEEEEDCGGAIDVDGCCCCGGGGCIDNDGADDIDNDVCKTLLPPPPPPSPPAVALISRRSRSGQGPGPYVSITSHNNPHSTPLCPFNTASIAWGDTKAGGKGGHRSN